jgi:hypothetical protein
MITDVKPLWNTHETFEGYISRECLVKAENLQLRGDVSEIFIQIFKRRRILVQIRYILFLRVTSKGHRQNSIEDERQVRAAVWRG